MNIPLTVNALLKYINYGLNISTLLIKKIAELLSLSIIIIMTDIYKVPFL